MNRHIALIMAVSCGIIANSMQAAQQESTQEPRIFQLILLTAGQSFFAEGLQHPITQLSEWICAHPDDVTLFNSRGQTPLIYAIWLRHVEAVKILVSCPQTNVNIQDAAGQIPLNVAVTPVMDIFGHAATENDFDNELVQLIKKQSIEIIKLLMQKGARPTTTDIVGHTALASAHPLIRPELQNLINQQNDRLLLEGARRGNWRAVQLAMRDGANINAQDTRATRQGNTAAHYAIAYAIDNITTGPVAQRQEALNFVRLILSYSPNMNIHNQGQEQAPGFSAIELASTWPEICSVFLETEQQRMQTLQADPNYRS